MNLISQHLGGSEGLEVQDQLVYILNLMSVWATQQDLVQKKKNHKEEGVEGRIATAEEERIVENPSNLRKFLNLKSQLLKSCDKA